MPQHDAAQWISKLNLQPHPEGGITENGDYQLQELSGSMTGKLSLVVPAGLWFAADIPSKHGYSLVSCAVAPGFEFTEFQMGDKSELIRSYPAQEALFDRLCR